jgi:translin
MFKELTDHAHQDFEARHLARENALRQTRQLTRLSADAIRAIHRDERAAAEENMAAARTIVQELGSLLGDHPDLYHSGYTQDAIKEYVEARLTISFIADEPLPLPEDLGVIYSTYLRGMAETIGELRRRCLDILRHGYSDDAERLLNVMDEIFAMLVTLDYPDAITNGLRHQTDMVRGIIERTRADLTISLRDDRLQQALRDFEARINNHGA